MGAEIARVRSMLAAWRARGDDRMDPLRYRLLEAMEARARTHTGEARRRLEARLSCLAEAYAEDLERSRAMQEAPAGPQARPAGARSALNGLLERLARPSAAGEAAASSRYPELPALDEFRRVWARLRTERQLRASLQPGPADAGPLNSRVLVHRSIELMRRASPGYLQHFVAYVDVLLSLERMHEGGAPARADAMRAGASKGQARSRRRKP